MTDSLKHDTVLNNNEEYEEYKFETTAGNDIPKSVSQELRMSLFAKDKSKRRFSMVHHRDPESQHKLKASDSFDEFDEPLSSLE